MPYRCPGSILGLCVILYCLLKCNNASAEAPDVVESIRTQSLFFETFNGDDWKLRWRHSDDPKYNGRFITDKGKEWADKGLKIPDKNKYFGLAALLDTPVDPIIAAGPEPLALVVQYEVKYSSGVSCGGSYLKLLSADEALSPEGLVDNTPYSIMFGPDRCGGPGKVHLILRHRNPVNGSITEKHLASPPVPETNEHTHIYTLRIFPDHKYEVLVDGAVKSSGNLLDSTTLQPSLLPPRDIPDPSDKKPADWVDQEKIPDPDAEKPDDWDDREKIPDEKAVKPRGWLEDEPELIDDPAAKRPADWDEEEDGVWEPNQIANPKCKVGCGPWKRPLVSNPAWKGQWKPPLIDNPKYKGPWVQKVIPNPHYFEEEEPVRTGVAPIAGVALELWTVDSGYMFDNVLITRDIKVAERALKELWKPRYDAEVKAFEAQIKEREKEEELRKAEEAKKKKDSSKKNRRGNEELRKISDAVLRLFEEGAVLAPLAPTLAPVLDYIRHNPEHLVLFIGLAPLLVLTAVMLVRVFGGSKGSKAAAEAHCGGSGTDDVQEATEQAANGEEPAATGAAKSGAEPEGGKEAEGEKETAPEQGVAEERAEAAKGQAEITADGDDEDEEGEQAQTGARQRVRRAA